MKKCVIWGASGHALVVANIMQLDRRFQLAGVIDDFNPGIYGHEVFGQKVFGGKEQLSTLCQYGITHLIYGFGDCGARLRLTALVEQNGLEFASAVHPNASIAADVEIGDGTVVVAGAVINPGGRLGRNCIVNTGACIDHECIVGEGAHIGPGAHLGGRVNVGKGAWVAIGATIVDRVCIGAGAIVGAGSVVTKDVPAGMVVYGNPGRIVRSVAEQRSRQSTICG